MQFAGARYLSLRGVRTPEVKPETPYLRDERSDFLILLCVALGEYDP